MSAKRPPLVSFASNSDDARLARTIGSILAGGVLLGCNSQPAVPTWYADVAPLVQTRCGECHYPSGPGGVNLAMSPSLASLMVQAIESGYMPPWPPGPLSAPLVGGRAVLPEELALLRAWIANPILGDPADYKPRPSAKKINLGDSPDASLSMRQPYLSSSTATDETRCFLLPPLSAPWTSRSAWVYGYEWMLGEPSATHHVLALVTPDSAKAATLDGKDGRPGWSCEGDVGVSITGYLSNTAIGPDGGYQYPDGYGVEVPPGSSLILQLHYLPLSMHTPDVSGVKLWFREAAKSVFYYVRPSPSEVPSPLGVSTDSNSPLSRAYAAAHSTSPTAQKDNDQILADCGTTLADYYGAMSFPATLPDRWLVSGSCTAPLPVPGRVISVHVHAHTRAVAARIEVRQPGADWQTLLDIPRWRWVWESSYTLQDPYPIPAGSQIRVGCTFDNGTKNQWSAAANEPGHDAPAVPPLQLPTYHFAGPDRNDEMCNGILEIATD